MIHPRGSSLFVLEFIVQIDTQPIIVVECCFVPTTHLQLLTVLWMVRSETKNESFPSPPPSAYGSNAYPAYAPPPPPPPQLMRRTYQWVERPQTPTCHIFTPRQTEVTSDQTQVERTWCVSGTKLQGLGIGSSE